jgi:hypothetical protein
LPPFLFYFPFLRSMLYFCIEPENQKISLSPNNRLAIRAHSVDSIART